MKIKISKKSAQLVKMIKEEIANIKESNSTNMHIEVQNELAVVMEKFGIDLGDLEGVIMDMKASEPAPDSNETPEQIAMLPPKGKGMSGGLHEAYGGDMGDFLGGGGGDPDPYGRDDLEWVERVKGLLEQATDIIYEEGSHPALSDSYLDLLRAAESGGLNLKNLMILL